MRDALHGAWLGHPLHPVLIQVTTGAWLSANILDFTSSDDKAARRLAAARVGAAVPAALAGAADWSEQHEQQMRVGLVTPPATSSPSACTRRRWPAAGRVLRLAGLAAVTASALLRGHISFRLVGGANHADEVPHLVEPGWQHLMPAADLPEGKPVRQLLDEVPVVAIRTGGTVYVLADRCSHMSGSPIR